MKKKIVILAYAMITLTACSDQWDAHYNSGTDSVLPTLMQLVEQDNNLSLFARCLRQTGADEILRSSRTYTVWAPTDGALSDVDFADSAIVRRLVNNHIANYCFPTSTSDEFPIAMLNGKRLHYADAGKLFGDATISTPDLPAENGLLHIVSSSIPYQYNLREYISTHDECSDLCQFLDSFDERRYDAASSTLYDSVFVSYNPLLQDENYGIGFIGHEDSLYTMIVPDNAAWNEAVAKLLPYFKNYNKDQYVSDSIQAVQTRLAILEGLVMRNHIESAASLDSLVTTRGHVVRNVDRYLRPYTKVGASNGLLYLAHGHLIMDDTCTWNPTLKVEAEAVDTRTTIAGSTAYIRNTDVTSAVQDVSGNSYLEVSSSSLDGGVTFSIAGTLAGTYDIYCDFVAPEVSGPGLAEEQTRVQFQLRYQTANGTTKTVNNNSKKDDSLLVGGEGSHGIISVCAFNHQEFPVANVFDGMWWANPENSPTDARATVTLQVKTNVSTSELGKTLMRRFRLDRIRFVPVLK